MPYIITATTPRFMESTAGLSRMNPPATRRAVATLDEARSAAVEIVSDRVKAPDAPPYSDQWDDALLALDALGGTVGPLPDGTVIEVERVSGYALIQRISDATMRPKRKAYIGNPAYGSEHYMSEIIDAYNAAQGDAR